MRLDVPVESTATFHFALEGAGAVRGPLGDVHPLSAACLAVVPRGAAHTLETGGESGAALDLTAGSARAPFVVASGHVRARYGETMGLFDHLHEVIVVDTSRSPQVGSALQGIIEEQHRADPGSRALQSALMNQCLVHLSRHLCQDPYCPLPWIAGAEDSHLATAIGHILENPAAHHTVDSLAGASSMSRSTFMERFAAAFGRPPMTFLHDVRMQRAARLLRQDDNLSMADIAGRIGYASRSHFSHAFTRHHGVTPAAFRAAS